MTAAMNRVLLTTGSQGQLASLLGQYLHCFHPFALSTLAHMLEELFFEELEHRIFIRILKLRGAGLELEGGRGQGRALSYPSPAC